MSKASTTSAPRNPAPLPAKSAWSKGPPQSATTPSPRSQSPAPSNQIIQTHSRRSSTLGQAVSVKDGVSVSKGNVGALKQGSTVTFGSIDNAPASLSLPAPVVKPSEGVKSFGTLPAAPTGHVNGKASISSRSSVLASGASSTISTPTSSIVSATTAPTTTSSPAPPDPTSSKVHLDVKKLFQGTTPPSSDTPSPAVRNTNQTSSHQSQPLPPSQLGPHQYQSFPPNPIRQSQHSGSNGAPRSPSFPRAMPNGAGPRPQGGHTGGPPAGGLSSPRLGPHTHNSQAPGLPPPQMPMQPTMSMWPQPYYYPDQYNMYWYPTMPMQTHPQHQAPPQGQHLPHPAMPMSPRNTSSTLTPSTPTLSHTLPTSVHPPIPPPSHTHQPSSLGGLTPSPSTPSSAIPPSKTLNAASSSFVPRKSAAVSLKTPDGVELDFENRRSGSNSTTSTASGPSGLRQGSPGTPNRRPNSIRIESEEQHKQRVAEEKQKEREEAKVKAEEEEKARKEKEAAERKLKEEEERKRQEAEAEKERVRKAEEEKEKERLRKEEAERLKEEEEERQRREAEEREARRLREEKERRHREEEAKRAAEEKARKEEDERLQREREEREAHEKQEREKAEKERAEQERLARVAEEKRLAEGQKKAAEVLAQTQDGRTEEIEEGEICEDQDTSPPNQDGREKVRETLRIDTNTSGIGRRRHPGFLDLEEAKKSNIAGPHSALATARIISDIHSVPYPEGVSSPNPALNQNAKEGKFRYDREFLLQFMSICKEKPASLPPLDAIGIEPIDPSSLMRGGSGRHRTASAALPPARQASIGLGYSSSSMGKGVPNSFNPMGNFATGGANKLTSEDRFAASSRATSVSGAVGTQFARPMPLTRTASIGGPTATRERTRSKRGEKRNESNKLQFQATSAALHHQQANFEPVVPLQATANRWDRKTFQFDGDSPEMVERKVKALLNKLTMEKFDSISDQIISWANKSENEKDGRTLIQVIKLVFEKATDEATWSEMYARLCRKMMEQISPKVQDDGIKNSEGKPITGGQLFRKYLLNRCQEDFERGWVAKEATAAAAASKAIEDEAVKAANETKGDQKEEHALYSEEYYAAQKAKRRGLGLIKFIGELFKLQMLTERIMHECVKKLLGNVDNPEEEEIESLCKLLTTVGGILDTQKARAHMDVYFSRMKELTKSPHVTSRMQFMLQDVIELRDRKWIARQAHGLSAPTTIAQVHEAAAKEKVAQEKEAYQRQMSMSRGGSRRGGDRGDHPQVGPDGWTVTGSSLQARPSKAGDLSNFGKISKGQPMTFGPGSVFAGKKNESKKESISRTASSSNMFSMLSSQTVEIGDSTTKPAEPQRKRLMLHPRSKPLEAAEPTEAVSPDADSDSSIDDSPSPVPPSSEMSEASALKKIDEDVKEFFMVRNIYEEAYFSDLPPKFRSKVVEKLVGRVIEAKEADAQLLAQFFVQASSKDLCSPEAFEDGFGAIAKLIDDIICDAPKALELFAIVLKGASLDENRQSSIAAKSPENSDKLLGLLR